MINLKKTFQIICMCTQADYFAYVHKKKYNSLFLSLQFRLKSFSTFDYGVFSQSVLSKLGLCQPGFGHRVASEIHHLGLGRPAGFRVPGGPGAVTAAPAQPLLPLVHWHTLRNLFSQSLTKVPQESVFSDMMRLRVDVSALDYFPYC